MNRQQYLLSCLIEECAEVAQRATKAQRFGLLEKEPNQDLDNKNRLTNELNDLGGILDLLAEEEIIFEFDEEKIQAKKDKVERFIGYSKELGILKDG